MTDSTSGDPGGSTRGFRPYEEVAGNSPIDPSLSPRELIGRIDEVARRQGAIRNALRPSLRTDGRAQAEWANARKQSELLGQISDQHSETLALQRALAGRQADSERAQAKIDRRNFRLTVLGIVIAVASLVVAGAAFIAQVATSR